MPLSLAAQPASRQFVNCHTQALLSAYSLPFDLAPTEFELLTTCPFGVRAAPDDPHRLLIPYLDPDVGLDRACQLLGLRTETVWHNPSAGTEAFSLLNRWLRTGPVLLGPLDLGDLSYHETADSLHGCDHYVVALGRTTDGVRIRDPEGFVHVDLDEQSLLSAWAASRVPEGRGAFTLRRLLLDDTVGAEPPKDLLTRTATQALENLIAAARQTGGGPNAYRLLAGLTMTPTRRRSLGLLLPAASVRYQLAAEFARRLAVDEPDRRWHDLAVLLEEQLGLLASAHLTVLSDEIPSRLFAEAMVREECIERLAREKRG